MKKRTRTDCHIAITILWGVMTAFLFTLLLSAIGVSIIHNGKISNSMAGWISAVVWAISAFCGGMLSLKLNKEQKWIVSGAVGVGYVLLLATVNILFFEQTFAGIGIGILSVLAGLTGAMLLNFKSKSSNKKKMKYRPK